jgi:hypothetical protein
LSSLNTAVTAALNALEALQLQACENITGAGLASLAGMAALHTLNLAQCSRVRGGLRHIAGVWAGLQNNVALLSVLSPVWLTVAARTLHFLAAPWPAQRCHP